MAKTTRSPKDILKEPYTRLLTPNEDGTYTAEILEFSGCYAEGDTPTDAIEHLEDAAISWIETAVGQRQDIPAPIAAYEYSGRINIRLPRSLHKQAARFAERDGISLNQFFVRAIATQVGAESFSDRLTRRLEEHSLFSVRVINVKASTNYLFGIPGARLTEQLSGQVALQVVSPALLERLPGQLSVK